MCICTTISLRRRVFVIVIICLHFLDEIRDCIKDETQLSVVVGDVAHVTFVIARILGKHKN